MKPISDDHRNLVLVELHRAIHASASEAVARLGTPSAVETTYPPNGALEPKEVEALRQLSLDGPAQDGLRKVIADAMGSAAFRLFCVMDAVGDPEGVEEEPWLGIQLAEPDEEDHPMLHDAFFDTYWDFKQAITGE